MSSNDAGVLLLAVFCILPMAFFAVCCVIAGLDLLGVQQGDGPPGAGSQGGVAKG